MSGTENPIVLQLPAVSRHVRIARLTAAALASDLGFDLDDVDDLRVAVNEAVALMVDDHEDPYSTIVVRYRPAGASLRVEGERTFAEDPGPITADDLALTMLQVIVDEHEFSQDGRTRRFDLRKEVNPA